MFFKSFVAFQINEKLDITADDLAEKMKQFAARPCGSLEPKTFGWTAPIGQPEAPLVHVANGYWMVAAKLEEKILPASVVNEAVSERVNEIESRDARPVRKKEREDIRDAVLKDLLPKAFVKSAVTHAFIDHRGGWLVVNAGSSKKAEELVSLLRKTLGSFPAIPFNVDEKPIREMTRWVMGLDIPDNLIVSTECEMKDPESGVIRCKDQDLSSEDIQNHLGNGMQVTKLALTYKGRLSFVLDNRLAVKRLKFLDLVMSDRMDIETEDAAAAFDADFSIMAPEISALLASLKDIFVEKAAE